ncbi:MAG TPA: GDSL-type esterase/lipase family protein [Gemmataceae bacterium]|nr:GDSL-type esterase/lipase family protein [Gemmataceae bacterium]
MKYHFTIVSLLVASSLSPPTARGEEKPLPQSWDYAAAMKKIAGKFHGREGVVLHVGDSITYANPYGQWPRGGEGKTAQDKAILKWMHTGADNDTDGWWLARFDHPDGGRSYTACGGIRINEMLAGGKQKMPPFSKLLDTYKPRMVVLMLGTNDVSARRSVEAYRADMAKAVDAMLKRGILPIVSTIPPHIGQPNRAKDYNEALRELAKQRQIPLIDYAKEILKRRPDDWNGTLLNKNDVHPTVGVNGTKTTSPPTAENLRNSGYLLRGWLSVQKIAEVKRTVLDGLPPTGETPVPPASGDRKGVVSVRKPSGESLRVPVTRDTWFSNVGKESDCNLGGSKQLKLKAIQEMSLIDIDAKPLRGRIIQGATLHVHLAGPESLHRVTVGSFGAEWVEGTSPSYAPQKGSSTHNHRRHPDVPWTVPGSDLCSVMLGEGGTLWKMADAFPPDERRWQRVAVDPAVVAARVAGVSYGFLLFDDTGSEWTRQGEQFNFRLFPNRFIHSRESGKATAPYLTVFLGPKDEQAPAAPGELRSEVKDLPAGEAWVSWTTPTDKGGAGTIGFFVSVDGKEVPRYLIPLAKKPGENVIMHLRDLQLKPGAEIEIAVRAVDGAGNVSAATTAKVRVANRIAAPLPGRSPQPFTEQASLPRLGDVEIAILDELDKVHPVSGEMIPKQTDGYLAANHLWSAKEKRIRLHAARNEFVAFQVLLRGSIKGVHPKLTLEGEEGAKIQTVFGKYHHVDSKKGPLPDPIVPLGGVLNVPAEDEDIAGQKSGSLHVEIYVPHTIKAGDYKGRLILDAGEQSLSLPVSLRVWDFTLPDYLSFLPEMNCYGLPANERAYYRLAHRHRTVLNRVPYSHSGAVHDGGAPRWDGEKLDWSAWDRRFGPYFDGSAFADLPRRGVPLDIFYLPLFENWPTPMAGNYNGSYWADQAFPAGYRRNFVEVSRLFAEHFQDRKWRDTLYHVFFNGKVDFKRKGWSRGTCPWLLDEPASWQDYWALRYFGKAFHEGRNQAPGQAKLLFRCDISRPQWQRDALDGLLDYNVVGGAMRRYQRLVMDRKAANGEIVVEYGGSNAIEDANMQAVGWSLDSWSLGSDGVLPWQTIGNGNSWRRADPLSLFYPGRNAREREPIPSVRLKAYRRGQQDVEYLTLLSQVKGEPRWAVAQRVREALHLAGERKGTGFAGEDAGVIHFAKLKPQDVWALRVRIGEALSDAAPAPQRRLIELRTPTRHPEKVSPGYVSVGEVPHQN